jgi:hypothetical protein
MGHAYFEGDIGVRRETGETVAKLPFSTIGRFKRFQKKLNYYIGRTFGMMTVHFEF